MGTRPGTNAADVWLGIGVYSKCLGWCVLAATVLLCYGSTFRSLVTDWWIDPDYSFGLAVPFVIVCFIYLRRDKLFALSISPNTLTGLALIVASQVFLLVGQMSAEFFLQRSSIVLLAAGVIIYIFGWMWLRQLIVPLTLLELSIPLPAVLWHQLSMPLQLLSSAGAAELLKLCGLAVYRSGNILQLPHHELNVVEACSGLRSLMSMFALALLLVTTSRLGWRARIGFVISAGLVAVAANTLRICGTGLLGEYVGTRAIMGRWHSLEGWFVFLVAFLMLSGELSVLQHLLGPATIRSKS